MKLGGLVLAKFHERRVVMRMRFAVVCLLLAIFPMGHD
jgi:hypothetical protein